MIEAGRHTYMGSVRDLFYYDGKVTIGAFCSIANGVTFIGGGEHPWVMNRSAVANFPFFEKWGDDYTKCGSRGDIVIGNDVWIGEDAMILDGVTIGDGAIIGAGAVVADNVSDYAVVVGNPARIARFRFSLAQIVFLLEIRWWDWPEDKIREAIPYMKDIDSFLKKYG